MINLFHFFVQKTLRIFVHGKFHATSAGRTQAGVPASCDGGSPRVSTAGQTESPKMGKRLIRTPCAFIPVLFGQRKTEKICFFGYLYFISGAVGKSGYILTGGIVVHQYLIPILPAFQRFFRHQHQFPEGTPACVNDLCHFTSDPSYLLAETTCAPVLAFSLSQAIQKPVFPGFPNTVNNTAATPMITPAKVHFFHRTHLFPPFCHFQSGDGISRFL